LIEMFIQAGIRNPTVHDAPSPLEDPFQPDILQGVDKYLGDRIERVRQLPNGMNLIQQGKQCLANLLAGTSGFAFGIEQVSDLFQPLGCFSQ